MNNIHEKCLRLTTNDYNSNISELLESPHKLSIHKTCINYLMIEVYKYLHGLSHELMIDTFTLWKNPYKICILTTSFIWLWKSTVNGVDTISTNKNTHTQRVPIAIKDSSLREIFKAKIKLSSCDDCPCNLCKRFIAI